MIWMIETSLYTHSCLGCIKWRDELSFSGDKALPALVFLVVEEVAEWAADGTFFKMGGVVGFGDEDFLGAAADGPRLQF